MCVLCPGNVIIKYIPIKSKIDLEYGVCDSCGLIQGIYNINKYQTVNDAVHNDNAEISRLSGDSDYSEIRVGKQQMADRPFIYFEKHRLQTKIKTILDMRSARGDFALSCIDYFDLSDMACIEPDHYITVSYRDNKNINLFTDKYYKLPEHKKYNLIYSCHTLEHYRDPRRYLEFITEHLEIGGYFFLDIPNPDIVKDSNNFEEYFYDKHIVYFSRPIIIKYLESLGFRVIDQSKENYKSIELLLKYTGIKHPYVPASPKEVAKNLQLLESYKQNIETNRQLAPLIGTRISSMIRNKTALAFGVGRLFDVIYTIFPNMKFDLYVDDYLCKAASRLHGKLVYSLKEVYIDPEIVIYFTRSKNKQINDMLEQRFNVKVYHFSDFI